MDTDKILAKIEELAQYYGTTSNRMVLTNLRQMVTKMCKQNGGGMAFRIVDILNSNKVNPELVGLNNVGWNS